MTVPVEIADSVLSWIISKVHMNSLSGVVQEHLIQWSRKEKVPTFKQIEKVSKATGIPLGYFFLQTPPQEDLSLIGYRTVDSIELENPSRELLDTIHDMELVQDWMRNELLADGADELAFVGSLKGEKDPIAFAAEIRKILRLSEGWMKSSKSADDSFKTLRNAISAAGVTVMLNGIVENNTHRPLDIDEFRGFAMIDALTPLIFINTCDSVNGRLFTLLHEFVHICLGESSLFNDRKSSQKGVKTSESICNAVTAELLVPRAAFMKSWQLTAQRAEIEEVITHLASEFKCSSTVIARRALDNGFIDSQTYKRIAAAAVEAYNKQRMELRKNSGGGQYYKTLKSHIDPRFLKMLTGSIATGRTSYTDAFRLTNTNRLTFTKLVEPIGGEMA